MKRSDKETKVTQLHEEFLKSKSAVLLDYQGLNVAEITEIRKKLREASIDFKVVKNTLSKRASKETPIEKLEPFFKGPTATAISYSDPVAGFKLLDQLTKEKKNLQLKVAVIEGTVIPKDDIVKYADLPSKDALIGVLLGVFQAPLSGFLRVFSGNLSALLNVFNGIKESKSE